MRPTVRSRRLGGKLGQYRQESGLSGTDLAAKVGIHQASWSKIESGKATISPDVLARATKALEIPADAAAQLEELRRKAAEPGWWNDYSGMLSEALQMLLELESEASWIRAWEGQVVHGLLQTREYAERIITAGAPHMRISDIDRYVELRMRRQKRIAQGMRFTAIMGEAAIRQQVGGPAMLRDQLRHVVKVVREHDVTVQILPFTADAHAALCDSFAIIRWPDEADPEAVYVDGMTSWTVFERTGVVRSYLHALASVQSLALSARESLDLINDAIKDLQ
jgi:transcriptional regulator with XRE-family HTH domain